MSYCERVEKFLKGLGYKVEYVDMVERHGPEELWTNGGISYDERTVWINNRLLRNPQKMWLTLLHEAGHALAEICGRKNEGEYGAKHFGWQIAQCLRLPMTKTIWNDFNWEAP